MQTATGVRVGIVDDHSFLREAMSGFLNTMGCALSFAVANGKECLEALKEMTVLPDVLLLDIQMPVMNGFETAAEVRKNFPQVRILAHSMDKDPYTIEKITKCGASAYLPKGSDPVVMYSTILELANKE